MLYSKTTGGFYDPEIHGSAIPEDAVEISTEAHAELIAAQSAGKVIVADKKGNPKAVDPAPVVVTWESLRAKRDELLSGSDWSQLPDAPVDAAAWATYRKALRDLPTTYPDAATVVWPTKPE